jgi:hypothetical protein
MFEYNFENLRRELCDVADHGGQGTGKRKSTRDSDSVASDSAPTTRMTSIFKLRLRLVETQLSTRHHCSNLRLILDDARPKKCEKHSLICGMSPAPEAKVEAESDTESDSDVEVLPTSSAPAASWECAVCTLCVASAVLGWT